MKRVVALRAGVVALQLGLIAAAVLLAGALAPRLSIVPLPHLKNPALGAAELGHVLRVFLAWHLVGCALTGVLFEGHAFRDARRSLIELYALMAATSLASCHLFLFTVVPFGANFHALVLVLWPALHVAAALVAALSRAPAGRPLRERARALPGRLRGVAFSRWTALACGVVLSPGALAVLYKKNDDFANAVNGVRVWLNHDDETGWALVDAAGGLVLDQPMDVRFSPSDPAQAYALERPGRLVRLDLARGARAEVVLDLSEEVGGTHIEVGALSFALHPEFGRPGSPNRGFAYVYHTHCRPGLQRNRLARFDLSLPDAPARLASRVLLVDQGRPANGFHNGGSVAFDRQGFLSWSCGDFAARRAQAVDDALSGGVFRIDVDRRGGDVSGPILRQPTDGVTAGYFIPKDNPWAGSPDRLGEVFALGMRNPFRFSIDQATGDVWVGDIGHDGFEEVTRFRAGANLQWPFREGLAATRYAAPAQVLGVQTPPVHAYPQTAVDRAVIGGLVYRGDRYPALRGRYVFADNNSGILRALDPARPDQPPQVLAMSPWLGQQGITSLSVAPDDSLLVTVLGSKAAPSGRLLRLVRADEGGPAAGPAAAADAATAAATKFELVCSRCHGLDGRGEPQLGAATGIAARPDFTDPAWQARTSDEAIRRVVLEGGAAVGRSRDMPSFRGLFTDEELERLLGHLRAFGAGARTSK